MKLVHVLYSGLGGHGNVFFSFLEARDPSIENVAIFYGIEPIRDEYVAMCNQFGIAFSYVQKKEGGNLRFMRDIYSAIRNVRPDKCFLHGSLNILPVWWFTVRHKCKILVRETQANHLKSKKQWLMFILSLLLANKIIFLSPEYQEDIEKRFTFFLSLFSRKFAIIPNGINTETFSPAKSPEKQTTQFMTIMMQSRLVDIKDHRTLIKAFFGVLAEIPMAQLIIAGDGPELSSLEHYANSLNLANSIVFKGLLDKSSLIESMRSSDLYVHATYGETMSTAIMQAMSCGLPVIASDVAGVNNMVGNGKAGILVPLNESKTLETEILKLAHNTAELQKQALASRKQALSLYSNTRMSNQYINELKSL